MYEHDRRLGIVDQVRYPQGRHRALERYSSSSRTASMVLAANCLDLVRGISPVLKWLTNLQPESHFLTILLKVSDMEGFWGSNGVRGEGNPPPEQKPGSRCPAGAPAWKLSPCRPCSGRANGTHRMHVQSSRGLMKMFEIYILSLTQLHLHTNEKTNANNYIYIYHA